MKLQTSFKRETVPADLARLAQALIDSDKDKLPDDWRQIAATTFEPFRLMDRKIILSDETLGAVSNFEMLASRCDCLIGTSPFKNALAQLMARIDGLSVARLNDRAADWRLNCYLDYICQLEEVAEQRSSVLPRLVALGMTDIDETTLDASLCAHRMEAIELKSLRGAIPDLITPGYILALQHAISLIFHPGVPAGLRNWMPDERRDGPSSAYRPPSPIELPAFLQDLVTFLNESKLGPSIKVALMHYQIEATKMFPVDIEQISRALLVGVWRKSGLIKHVMPPIAITPALARRAHHEVLQPYRFASGLSEMQMVDEWVYHTARASQNAFEVELLAYTLANQMVGRWEHALADAGLRVTNTARELLIALVGSPVFSVSSLSEMLAVSFSTVAKIVTSLEHAGIITQVSHGRRNKAYECPEALGLFDAILAEVA